MIRTTLMAALLVGGSAAWPAAERANPEVVLVTELGEMRIEIFVKQAPVTAENFLRYVDEGRFEDATFYRSVRMDNQPNNKVKIEVIQGGLGFDRHPSQLPPIVHETTESTGLLHRDGAVSMARDAPGSASSEIFICIGDQPDLDFGGRRNPDGQGFAAFGHVVAGMGVVRAIQRQPSRDQLLDPKIRFLRIYRAVRASDGVDRSDVR